MFYVYILASGRNGTLYVGHTDDLAARVSQHKSKSIQGFTSKYGVDQLVWFEAHDGREGAFARERAIKKWRRLWKLELIERGNPGWRDLHPDLFAAGEEAPRPEDYTWLDRRGKNLGPRLRGDERKVEEPS